MFDTVVRNNNGRLINSMMKSKFNLIFVLSVILIFSGCGFVQPTSETSQVNSETPNSETDKTNEPQNISLTDRKPDGIYIIFDASGSMWGRLSDRSTKLNVAKKVLNEFVGGDFAGYDLALRVYGHRQKDDCLDSELVLPFGKPEDAVQPMRDFVAQVNALGRTPITYSLQGALKDFGDRSGEIILITDGIESCDADPCALVRQWRESKVKIKMHVVGFGLDEKSKDALKCLSEAAGTAYRDAQSAKDLAAALKAIRETAASSGFVLKGVDSTGKELKVNGTLSQNNSVSYEVSSNGRCRVEAGNYQLAAGAQTVNGNLYRPVTKNVSVAADGETVVRVEVVLPPRVKAKFQDTQAEQQRGSLVSVWQNGKEVGKFRPIDEVFIDEGTYEFRARPNAANELSVTESFATGDRKEIVFGMVHTVKVTVKMVASGSGILFRENYELWQDGLKKYDVHQTNGALVVPGTYDLRLPNALTPYTRTGITITNQNAQHFDITVPVGHVTFVYLKADGTPDKDDRCFVSSGSRKQKIFKQSGQKLALTPGQYSVDGWAHKGRYDSTSFEIKEGDDKVVNLRAK